MKIRHQGATQLFSYRGRGLLQGHPVKKLLALFVLVALPAVAQVNYGELHLAIADPSGSGLQATVELTCAANGYDKTLVSNASGELSIPSVPFGVYEVQVTKAGFNPSSTSVEIRSALPVSEGVQLSLASVVTKVSVTAAETLIDPASPSSVMQIGAQQIEQRLSSLPGRSVQDLVNSQPGWLYEGNAVLHPRGSEYQTQFVSDGVPLTDNRSPSFGPEIEADDLESVSIYTAGYPAEYGRKLGGVVELDTLAFDSARDSRAACGVRRQLQHGFLLWAASADVAQKHHERHSFRQHDRPLPQSGGAGKLHEYRDDWGFLYPI